MRATAVQAERREARVLRELGERNSPLKSRLAATLAWRTRLVADLWCRVGVQHLDALAPELPGGVVGRVARDHFAGQLECSFRILA